MSTHGAGDVVVPYPLVQLSVGPVGVEGEVRGGEDGSLGECIERNPSSVYGNTEKDRFLLNSPSPERKQPNFEEKAEERLVRLQIKPCVYVKSLELHKLVLYNRFKDLEELLATQKFDVDSIDGFGNTALLLAATLGRAECIKILLENGAKTHIKNEEGWHALHEARSYGNFENIRLILSETKRQIADRVRIHGSQIRESVERLKDLYLRLDWRFRSWLPFVSSFCPYDTIQIWKKGMAVRVQISLIGFKSFRWIRGNVAFLFNFRRGKKFSGLLMNDDAQTYAVIQEENRTEKQRKKAKKYEDRFLDMKASQLMEMPIQKTHMPGHLQLKRATSGIVFTSEKVGNVGGHETRVFNIDDLKIVQTTRMEHMSPEEIKAFKEHTNGPSTASELTATLRDAKAKAEQEEEEERLLRKNQEEGEEKKGEDSGDEDEELPPFEKHKSIDPPPSPSAAVLEDYLNQAAKLSNESAIDSSSKENSRVRRFPLRRHKSEKKAPPRLGRKRMQEFTKRELKPEIHMCDDFPITKAMLITLLDLVAPHHPNINKLRDFLTIKLPDGFPVKLTLPVFPTISANVTFSECKIGSKQVSDELFELPSYYERVEPFEIFQGQDTSQELETA